MEKKIAKKYADLIVQANNPTGRKESLSLIKQATKLKINWSFKGKAWSQSTHSDAALANQADAY